MLLIEPRRKGNESELAGDGREVEMEERREPVLRAYPIGVRGVVRLAGRVVFMGIGMMGREGRRDWDCCGGVDILLV